jgi:hypothetical protein
MIGIVGRLTLNVCSLSLTVAQCNLTTIRRYEASYLKGECFGLQ